MTPRDHFAAKGILLPAQHVRPAISPNDVVIAEKALPNNFQELGHIRVELAFKTMNAKTRDELLQKVKSLAASVGANTVVVNMMVPGGITHMVTFIGTAVYIPSKSEGAKS